MTRRRRQRSQQRPAGEPPDLAMPPTAEWAQHHDAEQAADPQAGVKARIWRRLPKVLQLYNAALIDRQGLDACRKYQDDYEIGIEGADVATGGSGGGWERDGRLDASTRHRQAREAVGEPVARLLDAAVVRDEAWKRIATQIGRGAGGSGVDAAKRAVVLAVDALCGHYFGERRT